MGVVSAEHAVVVGATSLVMSKTVRDTVRKGLVYGVAGVISAGDAVVGATKGVVDSAQDVRSDGSSSSRSRATAKSS
jgi:hypothetical protein